MFYPFHGLGYSVNKKQTYSKLIHNAFCCLVTLKSLTWQLD